MDLHEDKEKNLVTAQFELPGLAKENVNIDLRDNVLTISGESTVSSEHDEKGFAVRERRFGKFSRSLPLPQGIKVSYLISYTLSMTPVLTRSEFTARRHQGEHGKRRPQRHLPEDDA